MIWAIGLPGNDVVCVAQGGGKSVIIANFVSQINKPTLIICPNKEILEQNVSKMCKYVDKSEIGVYSASMNMKTIKPITFGTIQSMYKHPEKFAGFDIAIYDEADLHNPKTVDGMSSKLFKQASIKKIFGFTGTPYRQDTYYERWGSQKWQVTTVTTTKMINRYQTRFWDRMLIVINTADLMHRGYLTPIKYIDESLVDHRSIPTNKSKSDFDMEKFSSMINDRHMELTRKIENLPHKSKLVFCASVTQAEDLDSLSRNSAIVTGTTPKKERTRITNAFKSGEIEILYNVGVYTVGFDYPQLDCIVLLRPTRSLRLHSQILGRVSRIAEGKDFGYVYDFVGNVSGLGKLENIKVVKIPSPKSGQLLWNVVSPTMPNGFHYEPLYKYRRKAPK